MIRIDVETMDKFELESACVTQGCIECGPAELGIERYHVHACIMDASKLT
jgi:hypothetical protein